VLHRSEAKGEENSDFELSFKTVKYTLEKLARAYYHKHISIAYLLYDVTYWLNVSSSRE